MRRATRTVTLALLGLFVVSGVWGQDWTLNGLEGVGKVQVLVSDLHAEGAAATGITKESLETTLRAELLKEGWDLVSAAEAGEEPVVYLWVSLMPLDNGTTVYVLDLTVRDKVLLTRGDDLDPVWLWAWAEVWKATGKLGSRPHYELSAHMNERITEMVIELAEDWLDANFLF